MALYFEKEMALNPFPMKRSVLLLLFLVGLVLQGTSALSQSAPKIYFNFGKNYLGTFPWNNAGSDPSSGMVFPNLTTDASHQSGINVQLTTSWGGLHFDGATTGDNSGVVPDNVLKEYYWFGIFGAPDVAKFKITGLMPGATYNLKFIGSSVFRGGGVTDNGTTIYQVDSSAVSLYVEGNTSNLAVLNGIECSTSGEIDVTLSKGPNTTVGYINGFILELPLDILYTPPGFSASQNSGDVNLSWTDNNTTETGYEVYRANVTEGRPFELLTSTSMNATSYSDQSTEEGYTYQYKIRAVNSGNLSGFSLVNEIVVPHTLASGPITVGNRIYFNANKLFSGSSPWNNGGKDPIKGLRFTNLVDDNGTESAINLELLTSWGGLHDAGASSGDNSGIVPDNVLKEYFWFGIFGAPEQAIFKIDGLAPGSAYNIRFVGSSNFHESGISDNGHTVFSVGGHKDSVDVEANVSQVAEVLKVEANSKGELIVAVSKGADAQVGYLNAFILDLPQGMLYASPRFRGEYTTGVGTGLEWDDNNSSETGYEIYRKNVSLGGSFSLLATTAANDTSFLDTSPTINTIYSYKIRAVGSSVASGFSEEIEVRTIPVKKVLINFTKLFPLYHRGTIRRVSQQWAKCSATWQMKTA